MSLKSRILEKIVKDGFISLDDVYFIAADEGQKQTTAERTLSPSKSPEIRAVKRDNGTIKGYVLSGLPIKDKMYRYSNSSLKRISMNPSVAESIRIIKEESKKMRSQLKQQYLF